MFKLHSWVSMSMIVTNCTREPSFCVYTRLIKRTASGSNTDYSGSNTGCKSSEPLKTLVMFGYTTFKHATLNHATLKHGHLNTGQINTRTYNHTTVKHTDI